MSCLNCNKETADTQVFCEECLKAMEDYPIEKGTPITIPVQPSSAPVKKQPTRWYASAEDELAAAQRVSRWLALALIIISLLLTLAAVALIYLTTSDGELPLIAEALVSMRRIGCFT